MAKYRRFNKEDWWAWGGAEPFSNNMEPLIYETCYGQDNEEGYLIEGEIAVTVIVDKCGIGIYFGIEDYEEGTIGYHKDLNLTALQGEVELKHLIDFIEKFEYAQDLVYELDHSTNDITKGFYMYC